MVQKKFVLDVQFPEKYNATSKARTDVINALSTESFRSLKVQLPSSKVAFRKLLDQINGKISKGDVLLFQYPTSMGFINDYALVLSLKKRGVKLIAIVHDVESLRDAYPFYRVDKRVSFEAHFLNFFDFVIGSNEAMIDVLQKAGLNTANAALRIFDYLQDSPKQRNNFDDHVINFAGNLGKSKFVSKLINSRPESLMGFKVALFGPNFKGEENENTQYMGTFPPTELSDQLQDGFGLVWDGDSLVSCTGPLGHYLKYNSPHKLSLYLSSNIPVIVWKESAMADFVSQANVGTVVDSLEQLNDVLHDMSNSDFQIMSSNVEIIGERLRQGYYVKYAVNTALKQLEESFGGKNESN